jgi:hypothetical protein
VPSGNSVHLSVLARPPSGASIQVYGSVPFTEHGIGADLAPDASSTVALAILRERATLGQVAAR